MDAILKTFPPRSDAGSAADAKPSDAAHRIGGRPGYMDKPVTDRPSQEEVEAAVRTLIRWTGDNPEREGLLDTPRRTAKCSAATTNARRTNSAAPSRR